MSQPLDVNPYSPPASDPQSPPETSNQYKFVPNVLWFVPGCAIGFLMVMGFGGVGSITAMESYNLLGTPSLGGWTVVIGIFALCSIPAVELEAILGRHDYRKVKHAGATAPD